MVLTGQAFGQDGKLVSWFVVSWIATEILGFEQHDEAIRNFFDANDEKTDLGNPGTRAYARKVVKRIRKFQNLFETRLKAKAL